MPEFTFLTEEQIWGDDALNVIKNYGKKVAPTDLTVILGGYMTAGGNRTSEDDLTCSSWSASSHKNEDVRCVFYEGDEGWTDTQERRISARPALPPSEASKISPSEERAIDGIRVAEYGEYPQTVADERTSRKLERLHDSRSLRPTGKNYTFDSVGLKDYDTPFKATSFSEYEMDGKRYIRVPGRPADGDSKLSTGEQVKVEKPYWVEVQPIEWLMDRSGTMVAKKCLFAGIQFDTKSSYDGDFSKTSMKHYLDTYFAKEMEPSKERDWDKTWGKVDWAKDTDTDILKKIENFDVNLERPDGYKNVPLMYAINFKKLETAKYLIDKKSDVNHKNSMGFTPLMAAAIKGHAEIVQKLLDAGANVNTARQGRTALDMAKNYGYEDIAQLLTPQINKFSVLAKSRCAGRI